MRSFIIPQKLESKSGTRNPGSQMGLIAIDLLKKFITVKMEAPFLMEASSYVRLTT